MPQNNPYSKQITNKDAGLFMGHVDENDVKSAVLLRSGKTYTGGEQYIQFPSSGRFAGGIVNQCPSTYQIKCASKAVDGVGFVLHVADGDLVIGAPSGTVHIIGNGINIHNLSSDKSINLSSSGNINMDCVKVNLKASAAINFVSTGVLTLKCSNTMYLTAGFIRSSTNSSSPLSKPPTNMGPKEIFQTVKKILEFIS